MMVTRSDAHSPGEDREYRRQRVAKACQTCRAMKSKCDGERPACARCRRYGYTCVYRAQPPRLRARRGNHVVSGMPEMAEQFPELHDALCQQEELIDDIIALLPSSSERQNVQTRRSQVRAKLTSALSSLDTNLAHQTPSTNAGDKDSPTHLEKAPVFLGEVSDVRFFNLVKRVLQAQDEPGGMQRELESYDPGDSGVSPGVITCKRIELPDCEKAEGYIEAYFSTIHLAYPFIQKSTFMDEYNKVRQGSVESRHNNTWIALIYTIFAIGAYYTSFPGRGKNQDFLHDKYFLTGLALAPASNPERSLVYVSLLMARCFYFLVMCRTESCWTTLGQAARAAQSIGLHVENERPQSLRGQNALEAEKRRRVWYAVYVLDRLLALQLGRPPAIHDDDFNVPWPSKAGDAEIDWDGDEDLIQRTDDNPSPGDYVLAMISFSEIVGCVLRGLYCPKKSHITAEDLLKTKDLDQQLTEWKLGLPRTLRFDLGHAFDKSYIFQRQRNMLAIKYHHLRALIHRPYLCYPLLRQLDASTTIVQADWPMISAYEKTCIIEARETARLLHGIRSEEDLVHSFPWWQMISCLVCASSILLISSIFAQATQVSSLEFDTAGLYDDAETCLKVFDALSVNSPGARIARDMMKALKECGSRWQDISPGISISDQSTAKDMGGSAREFQHSGHDTNKLSLPTQTDGQVEGLLSSESFMPTGRYWPAEIVDSMTWSAQFLDVTQEKLSGADQTGQLQNDDASYMEER